MSTTSIVPSGTMFYCHQCTNRWRKSQDADFLCPNCNDGFIEEVENGAGIPSNDPENTSDQLFSIVHRLFSEVSPRRSRGQGTSSMSRGRSRSPRMTFYTSRGGDGASSSRRHAFQFDLDDLMNSFLSAPRQAPVSQTRLAEIPKVTITDDLTSTQCSICFDEFKLSEPDVRKLPCSHLFHEKCIFPWLRTSGTCPVCRACLVQPGEEPEVEAAPQSSNLDNIIRFMRHRRPRRRISEEPSTSMQNQDDESSTRRSRIPLRRRIATRNNPNPDSNGEGSRIELINLTMSRLRRNMSDLAAARTAADNLEQRRRAALTRRRTILDLPPVATRDNNNTGPSNDIHRVARSRTYSDLLDNPRGPTTHDDLMDFIDLTEDMDGNDSSDSDSSDSHSEMSNNSNVPENSFPSSSDEEPSPSPSSSSSSSSSSDQEE